MDGGSPVCQSGIGIDEPAQCSLYLSEGLGGLHQSPQLQGAGKVAGCGGQDREHVGEPAVARGEPGQLLGDADQRRPVGADRVETEASSTDFLRRLKQVAPMKIQKVLTDNGRPFTDRFTSKDRVATGRHTFDVTCVALGIQHRLCPPHPPQTSGMVERFNGRISDLVQQTRFASALELKTTLTLDLTTDNQPIPQRTLKH